MQSHGCSAQYESSGLVLTTADSLGKILRTLCCAAAAAASLSLFNSLALSAAILLLPLCSFLASGV